MKYSVLSLCLLLWIPALAVVTENSASSAALNGCVLYSDNVSDYQLSPVIGNTGISTSFVNRFGSANGNVFGIHGAENLGVLFMAAGLSFTSTEHYRWQDQYISGSLVYQGMGIGYTQHFLYEKTGNATGHNSLAADLALKAETGGYGTEIRVVRMNSPDRQIHLTTSAELYPGIKTATSYIMQKDEHGYFVTATSYEILSLLRMDFSWQSEPSRFGAGMSLQVEQIRIGYGIRSHPDLKLSHAVDIGIQW